MSMCIAFLVAATDLDNFQFVLSVGLSKLLAQALPSNLTRIFPLVFLLQLRIYKDRLK